MAGLQQVSEVQNLPDGPFFLLWGGVKGKRPFRQRRRPMQRRLPHPQPPRPPPVPPRIALPRPCSWPDGIGVSALAHSRSVCGLSSLLVWMATPSSIIAWGIPWTEEPGGLQSVGSQRIQHDSWTDSCVVCDCGMESFSHRFLCLCRETAETAGRPDQSGEQQAQRFAQGWGICGFPWVCGGIRTCHGSFKVKRRMGWKSVSSGRG